MLRPKGKIESLQASMGKKPSDDYHVLGEHRHQKHKFIRYQWFWKGTQEDSQRLSPDLTESVKRHIEVKRVVPISQTLEDRIKAARALSNARETDMEEKLADLQMARNRDQAHNPNALESLLEFSFCVQVCQVLKQDPTRVGLRANLCGRLE